MLQMKITRKRKHIFLMMMLMTFCNIRRANTNSEGVSETCVTFSPCPFWEFECASHGCINMGKFCDGHVDCPGGSDEFEVEYYEGENLFENLNARSLSSGDGGEQANLFRDGDDAKDYSGVEAPLLCNNLLNSVNKSCALPSRYWCNGISTCAEKMDENYELCGYTNRYVQHCEGYMCMNVKVIECTDCAKSLRNCEDGVCESIEADPEHLCASNIFKCASDGKCLKASQFCDDIKDCTDGSDEMTEAVSTAGIICKSNWNFVDKECYLPSVYMCDGIDHCENRIDECQQNCSFSLLCDNGKCLPSGKDMSAPNYNNDGMDNCGDASDEGLEFRFFCKDDNNTRLPYEKFCDGSIDCPNGADEMKLKETERGDKILCQNKYLYNDLSCVLPGHHICDNHSLCKDLSDERICPHNSNQSFFKCDNGDYIHAHGDPLCNFHAECCDASDECSVSCNHTFRCESDHKCLPFDKFCDGHADCEDGSDEIQSDVDTVCNNAYNSYFGECILPSQFYCDGVEHCHWRIDECGDGCKESYICDGGQTCIKRNQFCDGHQDCVDHSDEMTFGPGFKCAITKTEEFLETRMCVVPQYMLNDSIADCDDKSDEMFSDGQSYVKCLYSNLHISPKQLCDGIYDCPNYSDECLCENELMLNDRTTTLCGSLCINSDMDACKQCEYGEISCDRGAVCLKPSQICDGQFDCIDKIDERSCPKKLAEEENTDIDFSQGILECPGETEKYALKCDGKVDCMDFTDECYDGICDGREDCIDLKNQRHLKRNFDDLSLDEQYCPYRFICNRSKPIDSNLVSIDDFQVCDGNIDCAMAEDEAEDTCGHLGLDRFYCERASQNIQSRFQQGALNDPLFVSKSKLFDGKKDCFDGSDECPSTWLADNPIASRHRLIKVVHINDAVLSGLVWLMAILALVGNLLVIGHTVNTIVCRRRLSSMMKTNCILVLNLALSDLLMGVYLLELAVRNTTTSGRYCDIDREWRSSVECKVFGTLAMISIQCSVLILLILTTYRVLAVLRPFSADSIKCRYAGVLVACAWLVSLTLACLPHSSLLEDYFTSAAWIFPAVDFFPTDIPSMNTLKLFGKKLREYGNDTQNVFVEKSNLLQVMKYLNRLDADSWPKFNVKGYFGFYSSNSVCLPQMFVTVDDVAWGYSFGVVVFDFIAFFYIVLSYIVIYHDARRIVANCRNNDENRTMQARITRLVLTDFICWMPICFMAFLSVAGVTIPPVAYAFAAIVLLPINSALNPILYSSIISVIHNNYTKSWSECIQKRVEMGRESLNRVRQRTYFSRGSTVGTMTTNDVGLAPDGTLDGTIDGTPLLENVTTSAISQNCTSVTTTTTRL